MSEQGKAAEAAPSTGTYTLKFPFEASDGTKISVLKLRRAKGKDILAVETAHRRGCGNAGITLAFLASVNDLDDADMAEIDAEDLFSVSGLAAGFLPASLLPGGED